MKLERVLVTGAKGCVDNWVACGDGVASQKDRTMTYHGTESATWLTLMVYIIIFIITERR